MNSITSQNGLIEEYVILEGTREFYNYSLSNSLDDIRIAIYSRTGYDVNLNNTKWMINPRLSISVKNIMNNHHASFSMTTGKRDDSKSIYVTINMRANDLWFMTGYDEVGGKLIRWDIISAYSMTIEALRRCYSLDKNNCDGED